MKIVITYKDRQEAEFNSSVGDSPELDLASDHGRSIFSIRIWDEAGRLGFSAYNWHNDPSIAEEVVRLGSDQPAE